MVPRPVSPGLEPRAHLRVHQARPPSSGSWTASNKRSDVLDHPFRQPPRMAKRRKTTTKRRSAAKTITVRQPAPVVVRTTSVARRSGGSRRRSSSRRSGGGGDNLGKTMLACGLGGAAVGFLEKTFPQLPTLTFLGKKGTIAAAAYLLRKQLPYAREIAISAAAIAGYEFGKEGRVSGTYDDDYWDPTVQGIASQI